MARAEELIRLLDMSPKFVDPNPGRDHIDGLEHNLRVATLARQSMKQDDIAFMGLVHDLARPLSDPFHGEVIAEIVRDMVSEEIYHTLRVHGEYQAALFHGTGVDESAPWHDLSVKLCAWEVASFSTNWRRSTMTKTEAVTLIYQICDGRD